MIIRSQDKKRIANIGTCNLIDIIDSCNHTKHITFDGMIIGTYSTEERAIKVLDMIQKKYLECNREHLFGNWAYLQNAVFQMPQDSEV